MRIRNAILKAADHIEANPDDFNFGPVEVPSCGTPGCALGWIGFFMGLEPGTCISDATEKLGLARDLAFYDRMDALVGDDWQDDPKSTAAGLRLYADQFHAKKKRSAQQGLAK